jgi:hypothetical protein
MRRVFITAVICRVVEANPSLTADEIKRNIKQGLADFIASDDKSVSVGLVELPEGDGDRQPQPVDV